jgi:hypothetical protein
VLCVAKVTFQVAAGKTDEDGRSSGMVAFALQAVKDFINLSHHQNLFGLLFLSFCADGIFLVDDNVSFRFLHFYFIALRNLFAYPPGDILRCGIKWEYFVQILMVEFLRDYFFDAGEIYHHSFGVEPRGTAIDGDNPVVTV